MMKEIKISNFKVGGRNPLFIIAGPCVIENEKDTLKAAWQLKEISISSGVNLIFKSSYDKANRSSLSSYRGPGIKKGLKILKKVKNETGLAVISDVHSVSEVKEAAAVLDIVQIPALLCRQTDLIVAAAKTKKAVNIKKGQFLSPYDVLNIIKKITSCKNDNILLTERGFMFGYNNLVSDMRSVVIMKKYGYPVIFDATHSVQLPGGAGDKSSGEREFIPYLAKAAAAVGANGIFLEVHSYPDKAKCDGPNMLKISQLKKLIIQLKEISTIVGDR
jgi:2-dehydro-3-deoxyphosphooctonate aldolase (KDO 8-P synthase)